VEPVKDISGRAAPAPLPAGTGKKRAGQLVFHIATAGLAIILLYPVIWLIASSFKESASIIATSHSLIPDPLILSNYTEGWKGIAGQPFITFIKNSLIIVGLSTVGAVLSSAFIAYGFARIPFKGKAFWFSCMMVNDDAAARGSDDSAIHHFCKTGLAEFIQADRCSTIFRARVFYLFDDSVHQDDPGRTR
jgi:multiple sugar transport system permease protein